MTKELITERDVYRVEARNCVRNNILLSIKIKTPITEDNLHELIVDLQQIREVLF